MFESCVQSVAGNHNQGVGNGNGNFGDNNGNYQDGNGRDNGRGWENFQWQDDKDVFFPDPKNTTPY